MSHSRVPNHKVALLISDWQTFYNYNNTIVGYTTINGTDGNTYKVRHHSTNILTLDLDTMTIRDFAHGYISQTTSQLVGKILRALPSETVHTYLSDLALTDRADAKRLARMVY